MGRVNDSMLASCARSSPIIPTITKETCGTHLPDPSPPPPTFNTPIMDVHVGMSYTQSFLNDPTITGHKPGSKRPQQTVVRADVKDTSQPIAATPQLLGEGAWQIKNRTEVSISPDAKPADPRFPLDVRERKHRVFADGFEVPTLLLPLISLVPLCFVIIIAMMGLIQ
jgi:hypothetical protein